MRVLSIPIKSANATGPDGAVNGALGAHEGRAADSEGDTTAVVDADRKSAEKIGVAELTARVETS
jgi:hypothetical protein